MSSEEVNRISTRLPLQDSTMVVEVVPEGITEADPPAVVLAGVDMGREEV